MYDAFASTAIVELNDMTFVENGNLLLSIPNLRLNEHRRTVFMGPNGAGKSLLLRIMHGLLPPSTGQVQCFGRPLTPELAKKQALVFQTPVLLRRSSLSNIRFVLKARGRSQDLAPELLAGVGLGSAARTPARRLSGGERQRLAIAQALAVEPKVLFLDEPTASLDPAATLAIEEIVRKISADGVQVVFVTHDAAQARRLADDVVFLNFGRVIEHTAADRFFVSPQSSVARNYLDGRLGNADEG